MKKRRLFLPVIALSACCLLAYGQEFGTDRYRTIDGTLNNPDNPGWGAAGENLLRATTVGYADGIQLPSGGATRPNPRYVSNLLFAQDSPLKDPLNLSDYTWVFGQFIDHDIGITPEGDEPAMIAVPEGDPWFDPQRSGSAVIPMRRNVFDPETGNTRGNPRQHPNMITAYIDGSAVYGSDEERADWLRTFSGGKLKTSAGNLMPYNTTTGQLEDEVDHDTPEMDDPVGIAEKIFVAGDVRANENPLLASLHTVFVREHNRLCDELAVQHPDWSDEMLYQHARKIVGGFIQAITYNEWLPAMGVHLPEYTGYQSDVNPQLMNVFTAAAFRLGHTLLSGNLMRMGDSGEIIEQGNMPLAEAFFNPFAIIETGMEPFLRGMGVQAQQNFDSKMVDDVRNFLFGPPGAGGLDLAAININRGRERGLPDFNTIRKDFGLRPYRVFGQLNPDIDVFMRLLVLYRSVNWIDPWVGMLAEKPLDGALFGETVMKIMEVQFGALRDGDRFFYLNDPVLSEVEKEMIGNTRFSDIIMRNTNIDLMQTNVFYATDLNSICDSDGEMDVTVISDDGDPVHDVSATLESEHESMTSMTSSQGETSFEGISTCELAAIAFYKPDNINNGVSTLDILRIKKHIIGTQTLPSPVKMLAADTDNSGSITALDLIHLRKVVLGIIKEFPNDRAIWNFIPADYTFADPEHPFEEEMDFSQMTFGEEVGDDYTFIGFKTGDVDNSFRSFDGSPDIETRSDRKMIIVATDEEMIPGEVFTVDVEIKDIETLGGYQFALKYDPGALHLDEISVAESPDLSLENFANFRDQGLLTTSWNSSASAVAEGAGRFSLTFRASQSGTVSEHLRLTDRLTPGEGYTQDLQVMPVELVFDEAAGEPGSVLSLEQNIPNPFSGQTSVRFFLPEHDQVNLTILDATGRVVTERLETLDKGFHQWDIDRDELPASGIYYYRVGTGKAALTKKMILLQ